MSGDESTLSVAVGLGHDTWEDVVTMLLGQVIDGASWSATRARATQIEINKNK